MHRDLQADVILLTSRGGQPIVTVGHSENIDNTALASLATADLSAADGLAKIIGEEKFPALLHQGRRRSIFISTLMQRYSMILVFDAKASTGLVCYKCRQTLLLLEDVLRDCCRRMKKEESTSEVLEFSDEELEALLGE